MTLGIVVASFAALELLSLLTMPSVLLRRRGNPVSTTSWLVALIALPGISWIAWWVFGRTHLERKTRRYTRAHDRFSSHDSKGPAHEPTAFDHLVPARALDAHAFSSKKNEAELLLDGKRVFPRLESDLKAAKRCINLFFFTFDLDETGESMLDVLLERSRAGVKVRLLVDGLGTQKDMKELKRRTEGSGIELSVFLPKKLSLVHIPRLNFVNHRKVVVIDNQVAFTGGTNVGNEYAREWRDLMVRLHGPAVFALNHVFLEDWYFATGELLRTPAPPAAADGQASALVVASGPSTEAWIHDSFFAAISRAEKRVWLTTPYLIPTAPLQQALRSAAGRGVDVRILIPEKSDVWIANWAARPYFRPLIQDGIRLFAYGSMVHAKALVVDDYCCVGSANLDTRSMELSFEACCFLDDLTLTEELAKWVVGLMRGSREVTDEQLENLPKKDRLLESLAHLFSPLL